MHTSLSYLGTLPDETVVYTGHEYTRGNLKFAKIVDPSNGALSQLEELCDSNEITAGKSTLRDEREWNIFMRLDSESVQCVTYFLLSRILTPRARYSGKRRERLT
jgi:hydroxyacylglutathione hydrolase